MGIHHACDHVINETITIDPCFDICKACQEEVHKREYFDCRWQKMKMVTLFVECAEKSWDFETFVRSVFVQYVKRKKNVMKDIQIARIAENLRA